MPRKLRVSQEARRSRVLALKMAGGSDRAIARQLAADPVDPVVVTYKTVNLDWHRALDELVSHNLGLAETFRALAHQRLERLLMAHWAGAVGRPALPATPTNPGAAAVPPSTRAAEVCLRAIADIRMMFGLDRELGDVDRPINVQGVVDIDYTGLTDDQLAALIALGERQERAAVNGPAPTG